MVEEELAKPGQLDDMMADSPGGASSTGYAAGPFTGVVPVIVQEFEDLTTSNLRGPRHRAGSSTSAASS